MDASLISRFDLIFLLLDNNQEEVNRRLAAHLMSLYFIKPEEQKCINVNLLKRYIQLAREVKPELQQDSSDELLRVYLNLRKQSSQQRVAATPRQLLGITRLAQARAKLRFAKYVSVQDVKTAERLMVEALKMSATDENGLINLQLLQVDKIIDLEKVERVSKAVY